MTSPDALSDRLKKKFPAYTPRKASPGEATPMRINIMALPRYKPAKHASQRTGLAVYQ